MLLLLMLVVLRVLSSAEEPCLEEGLLSRVDAGGGRRLRLQLRVRVRFHHHLRRRVRNDIACKSESTWICQSDTQPHKLNLD